MTDFGKWILEWKPTEPHKPWNVYGDAATLLARMHEALDGVKDVGGDGFYAVRKALSLADEFQEKYQ